LAHSPKVLFVYQFNLIEFFSAYDIKCKRENIEGRCEKYKIIV